MDSQETAYQPNHNPERRRYELPMPTEEIIRQQTTSLFELTSSGHIGVEEFQAKLNEISDMKSSYDTMTKLFNKKGFEKYGALIFEHAKQHGIPLVAIAGDGRSFKSINDTYGHSGGDAAIVGMGEGIAESVRSTDLVSHLSALEADDLVSKAQNPHAFEARFGGDEFVLLLTGTALTDVWNVIPKLRKNIPEAVHRQLKKYLDSRGISTENFASNVQLDLGMVLLDPNRHQTLADLFNDADRALYEVKNAIKENASLEDRIGHIDPNNPEEVVLLNIS